MKKCKHTITLVHVVISECGVSVNDYFIIYTTIAHCSIWCFLNLYAIKMVDNIVCVS